MAKEGTTVDDAIEFYEKVAEFSPMCATALKRIQSSPAMAAKFARILEEVTNPECASPEAARIVDAVEKLDVEDLAKLMHSKRVEVTRGEQLKPQAEATKAHGPCIVTDIRIIYMHYKGRRMRTGFAQFKFPDDPEPRVEVRTIVDRIVTKESFSANKDAITADGEVLYELDPKHEMWGIRSMVGIGDTVITNDMYNGYVGEM